MSNNDLINVTQSKVEDERNDKFDHNALLYAAAKSYLESYKPYEDVIKAYEVAIDNIGKIVSEDCVLNVNIPLSNSEYANFKFWVSNVRVYPPDSVEAKTYSNFGYSPTPNDALSNKGIYSVVVIGDCNYQYSIHHKTGRFRLADEPADNAEDAVSGSVIANGFAVNVPIPIGCKWCSLRHYDPITLLKSGEEGDTFYGYFIIEHQMRYIEPIYKKPFNKPTIAKNTWEEQLSRADMIYTTGFEYENSYYIVGSMVVPKKSGTGRKGQIASPPDFGFSLQMNHPAMHQELAYNNTKKSKQLFNFVPIKFLFGAFGCVTDEDLIRYICPALDDIALISSIRHAILSGYKHREAVITAKIKIKNDPTYILYDEPLTMNVCRYIVGTLILSDKAKEELMTLSKDDVNEYKLRVVDLVGDILDKTFMPGIGDSTLGSKVNRNNAICVELGMIIKDLYLMGMDLKASQDKASLTNRRVRHGGNQITREFKAFYNVRLREIKNNILKIFSEFHDKAQIINIIDSRMQTFVKNMSTEQSKSIVNAFKGTTKEQSKLRTEILDPKNSIFVSNKLNEIVFSNTLRAVGATVGWNNRTVHNSELFFICPVETPEAGSQTGRFKTPTIYAHTTLSTDSRKVIEIIQNDKNYIGSPDAVDASAFSGLYVIRVNGYTVGYINEFEPVETLYGELLNARRQRIIPVDASITVSHQNGLLDIWTDAGRLMVPFMVAHNCFDVSVSDGVENEQTKGIAGLDFKTVITPKKEFIDWIHLCATEYGHFGEGIDKGFVEYADPDMTINNFVVAYSIRDFYSRPNQCTHIALPSEGYGVVASVVPTMNLNVEVRAAYITNHVKQEIGMMLGSMQQKYFKTMGLLLSPQIPLMRPCTYDYQRFNNTPSGQNVIVAFMLYKYNQEDSIVVNQASLEQGLLKVDILRTFSHKIDKSDEVFEMPHDTTLIGTPSSYQKIDVATSLCKNISELLYQNDVLIAKTTMTSHGVADTSVLNDVPDGRFPITAYQRPLRCVIKHKVHNESRYLKMGVFGQYIQSVQGDKFNSECAQKGTVGGIIPPEKMPYSTSGMRPDIIFNPPSILKRKTFGQIYTGVLSKIAALLGCPIDCTPNHTIRTEEELIELMAKLGLDQTCLETLYDAETGRPYQSRIFFSNHYWARQMHITEKKLNIRNGGLRTPETNQPSKGRKHGGGQSIDRMTYDCFTASGIFNMSLDTHLNQGSKIEVGFCRRCYSTMCYFKEIANEWVCPRCGPHQDITPREIPQATALMFHLFNGAGMAVDYIEE